PARAPHGRDRRAASHPPGGAGDARPRPRAAHRPRAGGGGARAAGPGARRARAARPGPAARGAALREMKTVLVCAAQAPFVTGGAEILVSELRANLERRGFRADVAAVPFKWYPVSELVRQALAWRLLDVTESSGIRVDLVIPTKFPSFLVRHPRKVAWLFHQHREAYDLWGTEYCSVTDTPEDRQVREAIQVMDTTALSECRQVFTISKNVANRLSHYNSPYGEALYPPPHHLGRYGAEEYGDFVFYAGRLDRLKRLDLLVNAMQRVK